MKRYSVQKKVKEMKILKKIISMIYKYFFIYLLFKFLPLSLFSFRPVNDNIRCDWHFCSAYYFIYHRNAYLRFIEDDNNDNNNNEEEEEEIDTFQKVL